MKLSYYPSPSNLTGIYGIVLPKEQMKQNDEGFTASCDMEIEDYEYAESYMRLLQSTSALETGHPIAI
jgi:hypothetical protein